MEALWNERAVMNLLVRPNSRQIEELKQALALSELQALKTRLQPHFLLNTLQGISALIDVDKERAKSMVAKVSSLLRTILQYGDSDLVSLDEELSLLEAYLELQRLRLENRLKVDCEIDADTRQMLLPHLILQPLVENAVIHGVACCRAGGWIEIVSRQAQGRLEIQIRNSVAGKPQGGMGIGLQITRARLKYLYSDEAAFTFEIRCDGVATAALRLPAIRPQKQARNPTIPTVSPEQMQQRDCKHAQ